MCSLTHIVPIFRAKNGLVYGKCPSDVAEEYPVIKKNNGKMDIGLPCRCATLNDIKKCAGTPSPTSKPIRKGDVMGRWPQGAGSGTWGDNCQTLALASLENCCLKSSWKPNFYATGIQLPDIQLAPLPPLILAQ